MRRKVPYQSTVADDLLPYLDEPINAMVLSTLTDIPLIGTQSALRGMRRNRQVRRIEAEWKGKKRTAPLWVRI